MFKYKLSKQTTGVTEGVFNMLSVTNKYYSTGDNAIQVVDKMVEELREQNFKLVGMRGSLNSRTTKMSVVMKENRFNTIVEYIIEKVKVA